MYTKQALHELGVTTDLTATQKQKLDEDGFFIVEGMLSGEECKAMSEEFEAIHASERDKGGHEVHVEPGARRVSNIFNKTRVYDKCLELGPVLGAAHYLLGEIKVHGANMRDPVKGHGAQDLHADVPKHFDDDWWVLNAMVLFDDMTLDNGPTRIVPGSHRWAPINVPFVNQGDWEPQPPSTEDQARVPADLGAPLIRTRFWSGRLRVRRSFSTPPCGTPERVRIATLLADSCTLPILAAICPSSWFSSTMSRLSSMSA